VRWAGDRFTAAATSLSEMRSFGLVAHAHHLAGGDHVLRDPSACLLFSSPTTSTRPSGSPTGFCARTTARCVRRRQRRPRIGDRAIDIGLADVAAPLAPVAVAVAVAVWERTDLGDGLGLAAARRSTSRGTPFATTSSENELTVCTAPGTAVGVVGDVDRPDAVQRGFHVAGSPQSNGGWADRSRSRRAGLVPRGRSTTLQPVLPVAQHQCRLRESHLLRHDFLPARWCPTTLPRRVDPGWHAALLRRFGARGRSSAALGWPTEPGGAPPGVTRT
jgi:hypothetical protein